MARTSTEEIIVVIAQLSAMDERAKTKVLTWLDAHLDVVKAEREAKQQVKQEKMGGTA